MNAHCLVKHINALLRYSLVVTAVALLRSLLRSSLNKPSGLGLESEFGLVLGLELVFGLR